MSDPRIDLLANIKSRETRNWYWDAPHMEHERINLRAEASEDLEEIDEVDPLRAAGLLHIPVDGLRQAIAQEVQRQLDDDTTANFGTIADADYFGDRASTSVEALLRSLSVTS